MGRRSGLDNLLLFRHISNNIGLRRGYDATPFNKLSAFGIAFRGKVSADQVEIFFGKIQKALT